MAHQQFQSCIEACNDCADACDHCAAACLQEQDVKMMARCIALDVDCAQICRLAASFMARGSQFAEVRRRVIRYMIVAEEVVGVDPGVLESTPGHAQRDPLLRVHRLGFAAITPRSGRAVLVICGSGVLCAGAPRLLPADPLPRL